MSAITPADLSPISNFQKTNNTSKETMLKEELIKNYLQQLLPNSKDFYTVLSRLSNHDIKNIRDKLSEKKYKFTRPIKYLSWTRFTCQIYHLSNDISFGCGQLEISYQTFSSFIYNYFILLKMYFKNLSINDATKCVAIVAAQSKKL